jgi:hypothetical protein
VLITIETAAAPPETEGTIVLGLPLGGDQPNDRRYPIAVLGPGYGGLLRSSSTRIPGVVSIADVAPTALCRPGTLTSVEQSGATASLVALDDRIRDNGRSRPIGALVAGIVILALALVFPRAAVLAFGTTLAANLVLGAAAVSTPWLVVLVLGLAAGGAPLLALAVRSRLAVAAVLAVVIGGYLVALSLDQASVALSPLGPTQNSRFFGLSNLLSAWLLVPALASAALFRLELGWLAAGAVAGMTLATIAGSRFGADGGTAIVLVVAYGVLAVELAEARRRLVVAAASLAAAAVAALVAIDAATGASSHLTDAVVGGPGGLAAELRDRIVLAYERATEHWWLTALVAAAATVLVLLAARLILLGVPRVTRALPLAMAAATGTSLIVNDSPLDVVSVGLVGYVALQAYSLRELAPLQTERRRDYRSVET